MASSKPAPLRKIVQVLSKASSRLEPITVMLECGHTTHTATDRKRTRCPNCPSDKRLQTVAGRIRKSISARVLERSEQPVFVTTTGRVPERKPSGYRVLAIEVWDVTPTRGKGARVKAKACESLRVCCDAGSVEYVRAKLLEMGEALDGAVIVT